MTRPARLDYATSLPGVVRPLRARPPGGMPSKEELDRHLVENRKKPLPWLTPEGREAARELPGFLGPETYKKP